MNNKKDASGNLLPDSERITGIGQIVRKLSIDEIPQLLNVIKGEMSVVGPRPLLPEYLSLYSEEQSKRHLVRPGITGWAQVNGRNAISWSKKLQLDTWYVNNQAFLLDFKILLLTVKKVLLRKDISSENHATIEKFNGKN
jgi:lipopolysaccharide/colanic/teichoic acid biosynthesis glycosyltransferase